MVAGIGETGVLADGSGRASYDLPSGLSVLATDFETGEVVSEIFVADGKRMDSPLLSVDFLPGGVMVGGVRNGIISGCDSVMDASGTPICAADAVDEIVAEATSCRGCAPRRSPPTAVWSHSIAQERGRNRL
jgi:hypothetical protein